MITWMYLAKVAAAQGIFLVAFYLILDRTPLDHFKRGYLLASVALSFVIPYLPVWPAEILARTSEDVFQPVVTVGPDIIELTPVSEEASSTNWLAISLWTLYGIGVLYSLVRVIYFLFGVYQRLGHGKHYPAGGLTEVVLPYATPPHTFLRWVFFSEAARPTPGVLAHEHAHARQLHSLDRLLMAFLCVAWWWNPLLYRYARCLAETHELLADRAVVRSGHPVADYQRQLLNALRQTGPALYLASTADYSLTKKRFSMMLQSKPSLLRRLSSYTFVAGITLVAAFSLGGRTSAPRDAFSADLTTLGFPTPTPAKTVEVINHDTILPPPPPPASVLENMKPMRANPPMDADLVAWRDPEVFGIWVDGTRIDNDALGEFSAEDFAHHRKSRLLGNAKNAGIHDYQVDLWTKKYFHTIWRPVGDGTYEWIEKKVPTPEGPDTGNYLPAMERMLLHQAGGRPAAPKVEGC
ncbi:M56 family metallopeptidase [Lewinella sp. IMCC34191]|uniref:M56 family metallopeptidase n=1 Tax=Lewinella sp. IMCC34191 TaxID=2259172 RepID=UPI000E25B8F6|nr:M56 family metallopeptidase [Lewinella sp. IMCC34191]